MKITPTAHRYLEKLEKTDSQFLINALLLYEKRQKGYIKWLENRPGYRIKIKRYRVIFEFDDQNNEIVVLKILINKHEL